MKASEQQPRVRQRALPLKPSTAVSLMIGSVIGAVLLLVYALWYMQISNATRDGLKETALAVARTMADMPQVKRGLEAPPQQQIIRAAGAGHHPAQRPTVRYRHRYARYSLFASGYLYHR